MGSILLQVIKDSLAHVGRFVGGEVAQVNAELLGVPGVQLGLRGYDFAPLLVGLRKLVLFFLQFQYVLSLQKVRESDT